MRRLFIVFLITLSFSFSNAFASDLVAKRKDIQQFISMMVSKYGFDKTKMTAWFDTIRTVPENTAINEKTHPVITRMHHQKAFVPWYQYRKFFLNNDRVSLGVQYWATNKKWLDAANKAYGVPQSIIVSTLGLESKYGRQLGGFPVFKALTVLAFDFDRRKQFFTKELIAYLLYCKHYNIAPLSIKGSYAGAIGQPQFMPSNIKKYGVDFDHDGKIDLVNDPADIAGSIANFYHKNHWQAGKPVATPAIFKGKSAMAFLQAHRHIKTPIYEYIKHGIHPQDKINANMPVRVVVLQKPIGYEYWFIFHNFNVIKNYNNSTNYAMSIYQMSLIIKDDFKQYWKKEQAKKALKQRKQKEKHEKYAAKKTH